jgi:hypothetical protein
MRTQPKSAEATSSTGPLALWLASQLAVVALAAARVPLAAQYVHPAERLAPHLLLATQVVAAALLFPFLMRDVRTAVQIAAAAIPFQLGSAHLAGLGAMDVFRCCGFVEMWLLTLAVWATLLRTAASQMLVVAVAGCLTLGLGAVRYLRIEFGSGATGGLLESASPLLSTLAAVEGLPTNWGWITLGGLLLAGVAWSRTTNTRSNAAPAGK